MQSYLFRPPASAVGNLLLVQIFDLDNVNNFRLILVNCQIYWCFSVC